MTSETTAIDPYATTLRDRKKVMAYLAIQRAGTELIGEQGLADTTIEQIADRAGVSPRTFHRYFRTKEAVLFSRIAYGELPRAFAAALRDMDPLTAVKMVLVEPPDAAGDGQRRARHQLRASLMDVPAVRRFAVESSNEVAEGIRRETIEHFAGESDAALCGELLAALVRYMMLAGYSGDAVPEDIYDRWARAMGSLATSWEASAARDA
ncbi:TetR/AcrR family transcriptional regulator [Demequina soli]|uniref:TetR/AcrR family transcriptional regulator n=1 Tax=Demequina soli TaxID=1638987 RepID=UPI000780668E|nr:TetR/AcrR family transcriptional regulator [Demequina soli]